MEKRKINSRYEQDRVSKTVRLKKTNIQRVCDLAEQKHNGNFSAALEECVENHFVTTAIDYVRLVQTN